MKKLPGYLSRTIKPYTQKKYSDVSINVESGQVYILVSIFPFFVFFRVFILNTSHSI